MLFLYLAAYDAKKADAIVACPACSCEVGIDRAQLESNKWVVGCPRCDAIYGVVNAPMFSVYVKDVWALGPKSGVVSYVDMIIQRDIGGQKAFTRWHGWVDKESRKVVQVG
jgi:hypothetical protein